MKRPVYTTVLLLVVATFAAHAQQNERFAPEPFAKIRAAPINEMSGIVKSRRRENLYWVHNDSGDGARIFAIDAAGNSVLPTYSRFTYYGDEPEPGKEQWQGFEVLYADNIDWEDIAVDDNYLYIADVGNNGNARRDLTIYMVSEIDPTASTRSAVIKKLTVAYPEQTQYPPAQRHFDSESLFVHAGKLYLITKHRAPGGFLRAPWEAGANLYRLDTAYEDQVNQLTRVDSHPALTAATGADLSPDGRTLAVVSPATLYLFRDPAGERWFSQSTVKRVPLSARAFKQVEAVTWESDEQLLITNEQGDLFRVKLEELPGDWEEP